MCVEGEGEEADEGRERGVGVGERIEGRRHWRSTTSAASHPEQERGRCSPPSLSLPGTDNCQTFKLHTTETIPLTDMNDPAPYGYYY